MTFRRTLLPALSIIRALSLPGVAPAKCQARDEDERGRSLRVKDDLLHTMIDGPVGARSGCDQALSVH